MAASLLVPPTSSAPARIDTRALRLRIATGKLPASEKWRTVWGSDLDIARIADTIAAARYGIMHPLADLGREQLIMDPHLGKLMQKRFGRTKIAPRSLRPRTEGLSREEKRQAKDLREMVAGKLARIRNLADAIYNIAGGHYDGRAVCEIVWEWEGGPAPYTPVLLDWVHPRRLGFGPARELRLVETWGQSGWFEARGIAFDDIPGKFISYMPKRFLDYPELEGLNLRSVFYSFFKRFAWRRRNTLLEMFVLPWRTLTADKDSMVQKEDMLDAVQIAEALGNQTVAAFPPGITFEALWPGSENQGQIMSATSDEVDSQMSRLWMLTDDTSKAPGEAGGGQGGDQAAYQQAQHDLVYQLDGVAVSECIQQQLIEKIVELNAGPDAVYLAPIWELECAPQKDRLATQKVYSQAILDHVPIALDDYYMDMRLREPDDDEAVLVMMPGEGGGVGEIRILVPEGAKPPAGLPPPAAPALGHAELHGPGAATTSPDENQDEPDQEPAAFTRTPVEFAQPDLGHGSPEGIIARGLREGSRHTTGWSEALVGAVGGLSSETAIHRALARAAEALNVDAFAGSVERCMVRGLMLGALDAAWEAENDEPVEIPTFGRIDLKPENILLAGQPHAGFAVSHFQTAIAFFLGKKVLPRREFDRLRADAKQRAFTVAGLARKEMLETAHDELGKAIAAGADLRTFDKALGVRFESAGWTRLKPSHVELVFRNNVMGSYHEGRDKQMRQPEVLASRPYWQILGVDDARTRPSHRAAHGKVLRADDPAWSRIAPPLGHNCRCRKVSRSDRDMKRLGLTVVSGATIKGLPDPGWR